MGDNRGVIHNCSECSAEIGTSRQTGNRTLCRPCYLEKQQCKSLKRNYGVTCDQKKQMWLDQNKRCAICREEMTLWGSDGAYVDHNHETGEVRSLLCPGCNRNVATVESTHYENTVEYLDGWKKVRA